MKPFKLPDWTISLPNNACLNSDEVAKIFGYTHRDCLTLAMRDGFVPEPDLKLDRLSNRMKAKRMWSLGYLRKLEKSGGASL